MLVLAVPTVIYVVTNLVAVSFRNASAFAVSPTGPSILTYAWIFYQLPYGILAVALATAVFTELADAAGRQDTEEFKQTFLRGLRTTGVLMLPTSALLIALATPLVSLYRVGAFQAVRRAARRRCAALVGLRTDLLREHHVPAADVLLAQGHAARPCSVNVALTVVQVGLYVVLSTGIGAWPGLGINGMPIADVVFFTLSSVTLALLLRRRIGGYDLRGVGLGVRPHAPGLRRRGARGMGDRARCSRRSSGASRARCCRSPRAASWGSRSPSLSAGSSGFARYRAGVSTDSSVSLTRGRRTRDGE